MKLSLRSVVTGAAALVIAGGALAATVGTAAAATPPPWEPDTHGLGHLTFFDSSGNVVTGGSDLSHLFAYAQASTADTTGGLKATLEFANPQPAPTPLDTGNFPVSADSGSVATTQPAAGAPAGINTADPVVNTTGANGADLTNFLAVETGSTSAGFLNVWQIRVVTSGGDNGGTNANEQWWEDDILVNPTAGTWSQIFPAVTQSTSTALVAAPNPALTTQSVTLTATESPATAGSVDFKDGATDLGSASVNGSGVATLNHTFASTGSHSLTAAFTPTDSADFGASSGATTLQVNPPATPTTTTLVVNEDGFANDPVDLTATVAGVGADDGTVNFLDNGTAITGGTGVALNGSGVADFPISGGLAQGAHSIVAKFVPTDPTQFEASQSAPQAFFLNTKAAGGTPCAQTGSQCSETQSIETTVPVGTLVINTPYTSQSPLILPDMALNSAGTALTASAPFNCIAVTDTTSGGAPFTAQALAQPLTDTSPPSPLPPNAVTSINPENVGLTGLTKPTTGDSLCADTQSYTGSTGVSDNPAASGVSPTDTGSLGLGGTSAHTFATGGGGDGTVTFDGTLTLNAPTSTASGLYTGTIVFTVAD
jgi:hypothetical protein